MKIGKRDGCFFDDRIDLELSPSNLQSLIHLVEDKSLSVQNYKTVGLWREIKDYLQTRNDEWERQRNIKDKE